MIPKVDTVKQLLEVAGVDTTKGNAKRLIEQEITNERTIIATAVDAVIYALKTAMVSDLVPLEYQALASAALFTTLKASSLSVKGVIDLMHNALLPRNARKLYDQLQKSVPEDKKDQIVKVRQELENSIKAKDWQDVKSCMATVQTIFNDNNNKY